ncbi:MAG TPA: hypothetical protein PLK23_04960 [Clostridia bacterium]|nr:hypothetical protein [Clostridia bacterium]
MERKKKGSGISEVLINFFVLIYIMLPLFCSVVNKAMFYHQCARIQQAVEMAVISLIRENSTDDFSEGKLSIHTGEEKLKSMIFEGISHSCISTLEVEKDNICISLREAGNICSCGTYSQHFIIAADITATLHFLGEREFTVHKHMEFPVVR